MNRAVERNNRFLVERNGQHRSPGVLLVRQDLPVGEAIETLLLIWEASEADEWVNRLCLAPSLVTIAIGGSA